MDRKGIGILAASVIFLIAWWFGVERLVPAKPPTHSSSNGVAVAPLPETVPMGAGVNRPVATPSLGAPAPAQAVSPPMMSGMAVESLQQLENDKFRATFTSKGGGLKFVELKNYPAQATGNKKDSRELATLNQPAFLPAFVFANSPVLNGDGQFTLQKSGSTIRCEKVLTNGLNVVKEFGLLTNYLMSVTVRLVNSGTEPVSLPTQEWVIGSAAPMEAHETSDTQGVYWYDGSKAQHVDPRWFANKTFGCIPGTPRTEYTGGFTNVVWAAVHNRFFSLITIPDQPAHSMVARNYSLPAPGAASVESDSRLNRQPELQQAALLYPETVIPPGATLERRYQIYAGPKEYFTLSRLEPQLDLVMDLTGVTGFFAKGLLLGLNGLHTFIPSYGWSIVAITILIKAVFWPLTAISTRSMKKMQAMQPELAALKEKYKEDPRKFQEKNLELMKKHGVNPAAGCLPMLIQFPVFIGFVFMVRTAIELRGESFLWATDLSQPDTLFMIPYFGIPFNLFPLLMMGSSLWVSSLTPPSPQMDPVQQRMIRFMPIAFVVFFYNNSSGLTLYWTVQNLISVLQTKLVQRGRNKPDNAAAPASAPEAKVVSTPVPRRKK